MLDIFLAALAALIVRDVILEVYLTVKSDLIGKRVSKNLINLVKEKQLMSDVSHCEIHNEPKRLINNVLSCYTCFINIKETRTLWETYSSGLQHYL